MYHICFQKCSSQHPYPILIRFSWMHLLQKTVHNCVSIQTPNATAAAGKLPIHHTPGIPSHGRVEDKILPTTAGRVTNWYEIFRAHIKMHVLQYPVYIYQDNMVYALHLLMVGDDHLLSTRVSALATR
jgi:hypothetical protein